MKIEDLLEEYSFESMQKELLSHSSIMDEINVDRSLINNLVIDSKEFCQKYSGNLSGPFILYIQRIFMINIDGVNLKGNFVHEGRYRLENRGSQEIFCCPNHEEYPNSSNIMHNFDEIENSLIKIYSELEDFNLDEFSNFNK